MQLSPEILAVIDTTPEDRKESLTELIKNTIASNLDKDALAIAQHLVAFGHFHDMTRSIVHPDELWDALSAVEEELPEYWQSTSDAIQICRGGNQIITEKLGIWQAAMDKYQSTKEGTIDPKVISPKHEEAPGDALLAECDATPNAEVEKHPDLFKTPISDVHSFMKLLDETLAQYFDITNLPSGTISDELARLVHNKLYEHFLDRYWVEGHNYAWPKRDHVELSPRKVVRIFIDEHDPAPGQTLAFIQQELLKMPKVTILDLLASGQVIECDIDQPINDAVDSVECDSHAVPHDHMSDEDTAKMLEGLEDPSKLYMMKVDGQPTILYMDGDETELAKEVSAGLHKDIELLAAEGADALMFEHGLISNIPDSFPNAEKWRNIIRENCSRTFRKILLENGEHEELARLDAEAGEKVVGHIAGAEILAPEKPSEQIAGATIIPNDTSADLPAEQADPLSTLVEPTFYRPLSLYDIDQYDIPEGRTELFESTWNMIRQPDMQTWLAGRYDVPDLPCTPADLVTVQRFLTPVQEHPQQEIMFRRVMEKIGEEEPDIKAWLEKRDASQTSLEFDLTTTPEGRVRQKVIVPAGVEDPQALLREMGEFLHSDQGVFMSRDDVEAKYGVKILDV